MRAKTGTLERIAAEIWSRILAVIVSGAWNARATLVTLNPVASAMRENAPRGGFLPRYFCSVIKFALKSREICEKCKTK